MHVLSKTIFGDPTNVSLLKVKKLMTYSSGPPSELFRSSVNKLAAIYFQHLVVMQVLYHHIDEFGTKAVSVHSRVSAPKYSLYI